MQISSEKYSGREQTTLCKRTQTGKCYTEPLHLLSTCQLVPFYMNQHALSHLELIVAKKIDQLHLHIMDK